MNLFSPFGIKTKEDKTEVFQSKEQNTKPIVKVEKLKVVYNPGKTNEAVALNGINIEIYPEEYVVFFGPSGCGKSTLLNIIAGLEIPSEGKVTVEGQNLNELSPDELAMFHRKKMGMIFQAYNLISTLDILDNIVVPQMIEKIRTTQRKKRGRELLNRLGLEKFENRLPQELSGGQQQRVGIARALVNDPALILADEAVGNLDSESAKNVLEILEKLNHEDKKTIISVTHNPEHLYYADRVFYMKDGHVIKIEKNEKNKESSRIMVTRERTALDLLLQSYPDLSGMQLHSMLAPFKAKILANYLISRFEGEEVSRLENIIKDRLMERIDEKEMDKLLDMPYEKGGLGLNKETALKFTKIIEEVVLRADFIKKEHSLIEKNEPHPIQKAVDEIRKSVLDSYSGQLSLDQVQALNKGIEFRLANKIDRKDFEEYLDRPFQKGGVGLGKRTAKKFAQKVELILLLEFES